jgi:heme/copper-type cytochrome/quinol oxidase subunit 2
MPSTNPNKWRVFAITTYSQGATSPKSNTLVLNVISPFATWLENIWRLILSLLTLPALIVLEVVAILLILAVLFFRKNKKQLSPSTSAPIKQYQEYLKTNSPS